MLGAGHPVIPGVSPVRGASGGSGSALPSSGHSSDDGLADHLVDRGLSFIKGHEPAFSEGSHPERARLGAKRRGRGLSDDEITHLVVHRHDLEECHAPLVAAVAAVAAAASVERPSLDVLRLELKFHELLEGGGELLATGGTDPADQALSDDRLDRRGQQEAFNAEVGETQHRGRCVVGVQGGEDQVTGERSLDRDLRGFEVTNLTHQNDVGVLTQERTEQRREGQVPARC